MVLEEAVADYIELLCNDYDEIALPVRDLCITIVKRNYPSINISYRNVAYPTIDDIYSLSYNIDDVGKRNEFQANLKNKVELAKMEDDFEEQEYFEYLEGKIAKIKEVHGEVYNEIKNKLCLYIDAIMKLESFKKI